MEWVIGAAIVGGIVGFFGREAERNRQKKLLRIKRRASLASQTKDVGDMTKQYQQTAGQYTAQSGRGGIEGASGGTPSAELTSSADLPQSDTLAEGWTSTTDEQGNVIYTDPEGNQQTTPEYIPAVMPSAPTPTSDAGGTPLFVQQAIAESYASDVIYRRQMGEFERESLDAQMPDIGDTALDAISTIIDTGVKVWAFQYQMSKYDIAGQSTNPFFDTVMRGDEEQNDLFRLQGR